MTEEHDDIIETPLTNEETIENIDAEQFPQEQNETEFNEQAEFDEQGAEQADSEPFLTTEPQENIEVTIESVIEAVLFASDESLTIPRLAKIVETSTKQVRDAIKSLNQKYKTNNSAFRVEQIAGGVQMLTLSAYNNWLRKLLRVRDDSKLSPAALESLAIIAYKQPVIRADIEAIRGVAAGEMIRSLMYKGLVKIVGKAEVLGRPMLYGTTKKFLEVFGLNSLKDLPKIDELKKPAS
jgi:segregation and condensation protein B